MNLLPGFITIERRTFVHPVFAKRPKWQWGWHWLIAAAAWRPTGKRLSAGVVALQRGQFACTVRDLAGEWGWSKSAVAYFLRRLQDEQMITCAIARQQLGTGSGTRFSHPTTLITICNYSKFQKLSTRTHKKVGQDSGQESQQAFDFIPKHTSPTRLTKEQQQQKEREKGLVGKEVGTTRNRNQKPRHGARSKDRTWVWFDHQTEEWEAHAADYLRVRGNEIPPEIRFGGAGNWFVYLGESKRPKRRRAA
jgi:hypothetical protein